MSEDPNRSVEETPCPGCGVKSLRIELRLEAKPLGSYSLAGHTTKFGAVEWPYLICDNCQIEARAKGVEDA